MKSLKLDRIQRLLVDGDGFTSWGADEFDSSQCPDYAYVTRGARSTVSLLPGTDQGVWLSPVVVLDEPLTTGGKIIPSWQALTPKGTYLKIYSRVRIGELWYDWRLMFEWAGPDLGSEFRSCSMPNDGPRDMIQTDCCVNTTQDDLTAYQLMVELHSDGKHSPTLFKVAAQAMNMPVWSAVSSTTMDKTVDLPVPEFSQYQRTSGQKREGGEDFCSPTSLVMDLQYLGYGPSSPAVRACDQGNGADVVDHAARYVFDYEYDGAGNWPFNTAYAASFGVDATVRRFRSFQDLEALVRQRVPAVISANWNNSFGADPGMALAGTSRVRSGGHLLVVRGFTARGNVIVNEPANLRDGVGFKNIRRIYLRRQLERRWIEATGGIAYVLIPRPRH